MKTIFIVFLICLITSVIASIVNNMYWAFAYLTMCIWGIRFAIMESRQGGMTEDECRERLYGGGR